MDDQTAVLAFLGTGASYGMPGAVVDRIDTHASAVFLVGARVYKLKRAVRYSYLDYSTVALRERACRAELALNRRTAPALYLGVRAIRRGADGTLGFDGTGPAVDWVVEMRRFEAAGLFDRLAAEGRLTPPLLRDLADVIARFHAAAEPVSDQGGRAGIAAVIAGNEENLRAAGTMLDQAAVKAVSDACRARLAALAPLLDRRRQEGKVRRCHGDLHLGNICLVDGAPTLFDAVEFSAEIAEIDVLYDLAFLLMDLIHRDQQPFANLVFNRYLDCSEEEAAALAAMPLFLAVRATIRAHVSTAAAQRQDAAAAAPLVAAAQQYLALAQALLRPGTPRVLAIGGMSGTGKTTLAQALAADFPPAPGARILRSDVLRKRLFAVAPETRLPAEAYAASVTQQVYARIFRDAKATAEAGYAVIADAAFLVAEERNAIAAAAREAGMAFCGLWLEADPETLKERVASRTGDASDADAAVIDLQRQLDPAAPGWQRVAAGGRIEDVLAAARRAL